MKSTTAKKIAAIFSVVFGGLAILGFRNEAIEPTALVLAILMVASGVLLLIPGLEKMEKTLVIITLVIYSIFIFAGLLFLFLLPPLGIAMFAIGGVPFSFAIVYLVKRAREDEYYAAHTPIRPSSYLERPKQPASAINISVDDIEQQLIKLRGMVDSGLISEQDYNAKKEALLNILK